MGRKDRIIQFLNDYENLSPSLKILVEGIAGDYRKEIYGNGYTRKIQNTSTIVYTEQAERGTTTSCRTATTNVSHTI